MRGSARLKIAVFGAGGVGGYFGARLAQTGEDVTFIARGGQLEALRKSGIRVESVQGDFSLPQVTATDNPEDVGEVDVVLLAIKAWQVSEAAVAMRPLIGRDSCVVTLQNGVEAHEELAKVLGAKHVLPGLAKIISALVEPGHVRHVGGPASIAFGELDNRVTNRVTSLREAFLRAGVEVESPPDINVALWDKFLFVVSVGGLGAVTRAPIGVLRTMPETRHMLEEAMREILDVGRARGVQLPPASIATSMAFIDRLPVGGTTSLQRDIVAGQPSELDWWSGAVVRLGQEAGVPTPLHRFIYSALLPLEHRARGRLQFGA